MPSGPSGLLWRSTEARCTLIGLSSLIPSIFLQAEPPARVCLAAHDQPNQQTALMPLLLPMSFPPIHWAERPIGRFPWPRLGNGCRKACSVRSPVAVKRLRQTVTLRRPGSHEQLEARWRAEAAFRHSGDAAQQSHLERGSLIAMQLGARRSGHGGRR
jgi:hypothetical protein